MKKIICIFSLLVFCWCSIGFAQEKVIQLPEPVMTGSMPLMEALSKRRTIRQYKPDPLSLQQLSNLLWAAYGINDTTSQKRTVPSAYNWQEMRLYVVMKSGVFLYEAKAHQLKRVLEQDIREHTTIQRSLVDAPVQVLIVADLTRILEKKRKRDLDDGKCWTLCSIDVGFISQNIYLYCASAGLATVVRDWVPRDKLRTQISLNEYQKIMVAQTVGYPK